MSKQALRCEAFYGGTWNDITSRVRVDDQVRIARGQQDEGSAARPSTMSFRLDNRDGWATPTSPISPFYATAGRYTPVFCYLAPGLTTGAQADAADAFGRTVTSGWGFADSGQGWSTTSSGGTIAGTDYSVSGGLGRHFVNGTASYRITHLTGGFIEDFDSVHTVVMPQATGGDLESELIYRRQAPTVYGAVRLTFTTANAVQIRVYRADNGVQAGSTVTTGLTHAGTGTPLRLRVRAIGTTIMAKVWAAAGAEPAAWTATITDPSAVKAGAVGIRTGRAGGNTNSTSPTASYDNLAVTWMDVRFFGEINSWGPDATENFPITSWVTGAVGTKGDAWTDVDAAGIFHRLNSGPDQLPVALQTYIMSTSDLAGYWPLDDPIASNNTMRNLAVPGRPIDLTPNQYSPRASEIAPWLGYGLGAADANGVTSMYASAVADLPTSKLTHTMSIVVSGLTANSQVSIYATGADAAGGATINTIYANGPAGTLELSYIQGTPSFAGTVYSAAQNGLFDGRAHQISLYMQKNGTGVDYFLYLDGRTLISTTVASRVWRPLYGVDVFVQGPATVGHLAVWGTYQDPTTALYTAYRGYRGEPPADRFARIATQAGVPYVIRGLPGGESMGPQLPDTAVRILAECARTADALLYEPRSWLGLVLKQRSFLYNQDPAATVAYAGGGVQKVRPVIDTRDVVNVVTVTAVDGTEYVATRTAGPTGVAAVGRLPATVDTNLQVAPGLDQLADRAAWELAKGSLTGARFPSITFDMDAAPALALTVGLADVGQRLVVTGLEADPVSQLIRAVREVIGSHRRLVTFQGTPDALYQPLAYDDGFARYDSGTSSTTGAPNSTQTTFLVTTTNPDDLWTTNPGHFPFDVLVAGERITVTNVVGTTSPQQFVVTRSVNGVVKPHTTGTAVTLYQRPRYAL